MIENILGRAKFKSILNDLYHADSAEFAVVYGRRRIGKTFLIREYFENQFAFYHTALSPFEMEKNDGELLLHKQLDNFGYSLRQYGDKHSSAPKDWLEAFDWLKQLLQSKSRRKRIIVFLDELPWMDTPRSGFVTAFEQFWNGWGAGQHKLLLLVCGSSTTWITNQLLNNTGGLYGRLTKEIHLPPFTLSECFDYFNHKNMGYDYLDVLNCYMAVGGVPYYLSQFSKGKSVAQNIDELCFSHRGKLKDEFERLFRSLFNDSEKYMRMVRLLSENREGLNRKQIIDKMQLTSGGGVTDMLRALVAGDFVVEYIPYGSSSRDTRYKLVDLFSLFFMRFVENHPTSNVSFWNDNQLSPTLNSWRGYAFEDVCYAHQQQIKKALEIGGVQAEVQPWSSKDINEKAQIDMLIDRADHVINLCEMKYSLASYTIDKEYDAELRRKVQVFLNQTRCKKSVLLTMITTFGLKENTYSSRVQRTLTLENLFE